MHSHHIPFTNCRTCFSLVNHDSVTFTFFFNDTTQTKIYTLSLHDALPIYSRERSGINTILHELNPLFTINVTMRDIKSKNVYSRVNSKATTQWRKTESANGVHLEGVASDNRSS